MLEKHIEQIKKNPLKAAVKMEAMQLALSAISAKANVSDEKLLEILNESEQQILEALKTNDGSHNKTSRKRKDD